jgi:hypothetical protein
MKNRSVTDTSETAPDDLRPEYRVDYRKARPNRFAGRSKAGRVVVVLDSDVAQVFTTPEAVNHALRVLIEAMPPAAQPKVAIK